MANQKKSALPKGYTEIAVEKLVYADWNYKRDNDELLEKLKNNIKRNGQIENIIVRELDTGFFEVVNGNHRVKALEQLNIQTVVAYNLGSITLPQAQRIAIETNETRFETQAPRLEALLSEIMNEFDLDDISDTMAFNADEITALAKIEEYDPDDFMGKASEYNPEAAQGETGHGGAESQAGNYGEEGDAGPPDREGFFFIHLGGEEIAEEIYEQFNKIKADNDWDSVETMDALLQAYRQQTEGE